MHALVQIFIYSSLLSPLVIDADSSGLPVQRKRRRLPAAASTWVSQHFDSVFSSHQILQHQHHKHRKVEEQEDDDIDYYEYAGDDAAYQGGQNAAYAGGDDAQGDAAEEGDDYYEYGGDDDGKRNQDDDDDNIFKGDNELCSQFLVNFLEGTTDARDTCEGIMNAYVAAQCSDSSYSETKGENYNSAFEEFSEHQCCQALMMHHSDYCESEALLSNLHLFVASAVLLLCELAKAIVSRLQIHCLPEAAVCILVGTFVGLLSSLFGHNMDNIVFDDELFLSLLLPPIIFEAALKVSKKEFKRRRGAIFMFSVIGTVISTFTTGLLVHYLSKASSATAFPMLDSLVFGALISSIDPVAILSVLTSLNMDQKDTIFILVFGESLLNDGIAITVFQTLVDRFDGKTTSGSTSVSEISNAFGEFIISMFGSLTIGFACGVGAWGFFTVLGKTLPPVMEVGSFFLWALIPYYISDGVGWSGIVSIVAVAFFMDIYIAGPKNTGGPKTPRMTPRQVAAARAGSNSSLIKTPSGSDRYIDMDIEVRNTLSFDAQSIAPLPSTDRIRLSAEADKHVRFVAHLVSQLAENAIFAYLGLFLFGPTYDWNPTLVSIAIFSCVFSRALMVMFTCTVIVKVYRLRGRIGVHGMKPSRTAAAIQDYRTRAVLVLAGLRGAVSLALVENVPIYNGMTGQGCEYKQLMKGMTSASILFTTFVFGGGAYYILPHLGISPEDNLSVSSSGDEADDLSDATRKRSQRSLDVEPPSSQFRSAVVV